MFAQIYRASDDDPAYDNILQKRKDITHMDYENFKEQFVADVKERFAELLHTFQDMAKEAGAVYHVKRCVLVNTEKLDQYLEHFCDTE